MGTIRGGTGLASAHGGTSEESFYFPTTIPRLLATSHVEAVDRMNGPQILFHFHIEHDRDDCNEVF